MIKKIYKKIFPKKFGNFWNTIKDNKNIDNDLRFISESFINSDSYKYVSNQWHLYNIISYNSLINSGLNNYGSEISTHYFTFKDYENNHLNNLFKDKDSSLNNLNVNIFKKHKNFNFKESILYNSLCTLMYENLKSTNYYKYLKFLKDETFLGYNDPYININDEKISTDKINSLFDFEKIDSFYNFNENDHILEIGSGSGRFSDCILSIKKNLNYTICEIPPSMYISYKRLKKSFPNKKIEILINCNSNENIMEKIKKNNISLIFPHQLNFIKEKFFNLTIAIDCLHEMDKKTLKRYFNNINTISEKMYFSILEKTKNWNSAGIIKKTERLNFNKNDYPIPDSWNNIFKEYLKFPSNYIGVGYDIKDSLDN